MSVNVLLVFRHISWRSKCVRILARNISIEELVNKGGLHDIEVKKIRSELDNCKL